MLIEERQSATLCGSALETKAPARLKSGAAFRGRGHTNLKGSAPLLFLLVFMLMAWPIFAQAGHGGISGLVTDTSGAVIPGAKVEAKSLSTDAVFQTITSVFWNPSPTPQNMAGFGQITSDLNTPRQMQFAARFMF